MATQSAAAIYDKVVSGEAITDAEIDFGRVFYRDLADNLSKCGPVFKLAAQEANRIYMALSLFYQERHNR